MKKLHKTFVYSNTFFISDSSEVTRHNIHKYHNPPKNIQWCDRGGHTLYNKRVSDEKKHTKMEKNISQKALTSLTHIFHNLTNRIELIVYLTAIKNN